jgi:hypothetical protein
MSSTGAATRQNARRRDRGNDENEGDATVSAGKSNEHDRRMLPMT